MKKQFVLTVLATSLFLAACNQQMSGTPTSASGAAAASVPVGLETESKQLGYMLGYEFAQSMQLDTLKKNGIEVDSKALIEALNEQMDGKPSRVSPEQADIVMKSIREKVMAVAAKQASEAIVAGEKFLAENKTKEGVKTTDSGLQYKVNKEGTGAQAALGDLVSVEYEGRLTDGTVFDSTQEHGGTPFAVPLIEGTVIKGWTEGLQLMKEGGEYTVYVPAALAYGAQSPSPKIPANSVLVFDMKIVKVEKDGAVKLQQEQMKAEEALKKSQPKK
ncbi:FKBP-type peptidyl-prolyl cis-trans isomerase [Wielerella bovis]|uniref:FKBP-type peptidyl-prolyl cis-trans isomerase n=1 Tax=Wielerella bovis TaxID=2917790 RepID=UPI00201929BD|nr:FKBP-type peptidyl-prolyl cis-trans isomerase [Wielerella bovis]ULJ65410.1 FKBP-type peptidyl-prolyl cis-trans isomerase [Wielerella bovis]ULJ67755.1 FKBP-type peptidyl-prolyl cis-trans isomerase [Wielerella bovis]